MVEFTWQARSRLDEYLREVRWSLRGCRSVDAGEVESNVREHVDSAFGEAAGPVDVDELDGVLNELGSPLQWVAVEDLPWWRRMLVKWRSGRGGNRAAWLSFALLVLAAVCLVYAAAVPDYEYVSGPMTVQMNGRVYRSSSPRQRISNDSVHVAAGLTAVFLLASFLVARMVVSAGELTGQGCIRSSPASTCRCWAVCWRRRSPRVGRSPTRDRSGSSERWTCGANRRRN